MAAISLRDYVREIEKQVEGGRNEEAIAHCRHVLESFPKHVDTYRLLGKAYLESQRYGDAGDIFQRVLSAIPDDFVAHVGISIIREDEGNLDEAIWHMERAFDVQPSNSAIQDELRRLYGRRDNVEPPKIRLTRGALARMYFKGELYPQAIAELRAALNEYPDRLELQLLLAETYAKSGQRAEAVDLAGQVLRKLPFCIAANQVMVDMLIGTEQEAETQAFIERLGQLDPYAAYVTVASPKVEDVPDQAVRLNKLDYKVSQTATSAPSQPVWAATLGVAVAENASDREESLPEWLASGPATPPVEGELAESTPAQAASVEEAPAAGQEPPGAPGTGAEEEQIPEWMKELGWTPASEESRAAEAAMQPMEAAGDLEVEGELAPAEIPDWLKEMAPSDVAPEGKAEEDVAPWLDQLFTAEPQIEGVDLEADLSSTGTPSESADLKGAGMVLGAAVIGAAALGREDEEPGDTEAAQVQPEEEAIDELMLAETSADVSASAEIATGWPVEEQDMSMAEAIEVPGEPGEAAEMALEEGIQASAEPAEEQLQALESEGAPAEALTVAKLSQEFPDWLEEGMELPAEPAAEMAPSEGEPAEWLLEESDLEEATPGEEALAAMQAEQIPDWLAEGEVTPASEAVNESFTEEAAGMEEELPAWLLEDETALEEQGLTEAATEETEDLPRWLFEAAAEQQAEAGAEAGEEIEKGTEGMPDWLKAAGAVAGTAGAFEVFEWLNEEEEPSFETGFEPSAALLGEEIVEWPAELTEAADQEGTAPAVLDEEQPMVETAQVDLGDTQPTRVTTVVEAPVPDPELEEALAWLDSMLTPTPEKPEPSITPPPVEEPVELIELPPLVEEPAVAIEMRPPIEDQAEAIEMPPPVEEPAETIEMQPPIEDQAEAIETQPAIEEPAEAAEMQPSIEEPVEMLETQPTAEVEPTASTETPGGAMPIDDDAAFAWLESLAVRQGAQEALLLKPEERREEPPDWLKAAVAVEAGDLLLDKFDEKVEAGTAPEPETEAAAVEEFPEAKDEGVASVEPAPPEIPIEETPELPDWLAEPASETREESLDWTPPPVARRKYDVNKITLAELERLPGIGFIMAQRVIEYRNTRGQFRKIDDLLNVPEFTDQMLEGVRENLYLATRPEPATAASPTPTHPRPDTATPVMASGAGLPDEVVKARRYLVDGMLDEALALYSALIHSKQQLGVVVDDLKQASSQYPDEFYVWRTLGDAYLRSDLTSEATQAFIQAEKLLV